MKAGSWYTSTFYGQIGEVGSGVPVLSGRWTRPPLWYCVAALFQGVNMAVFGAAIAVTHPAPRELLDFAPAWLQQCEPPFGVLMSALGLALVWRGVWLFGVRRQLRRLTAANELAAQFGTDGETLERVARRSKIRPAYRVNGVDYYGRAAFADAATLLRPAEAPKPALLRPAASSHEEAAERLLRASNRSTDE